MGLTPAPVNAWYLAWVALVPLWVLVSQPLPWSSGLHKRPLLPIVCGLTWGLGYHGLALSWITDLHPLTWMGIPWLGSIAIALFAWGFITVWGAILVMLWVWLFGIACAWSNRSSVGSAHSPGRANTRGLNPSQMSAIRVLIGTAIWCSLEAIWSWGPLDWTSVSYTQSPYNLAILHLGQVSGPFTVSAAIVAVNGLIAEALLQDLVRRQTRRLYPGWLTSSRPVRYLLGSAIALLVSLHGLGFWLYSQPLQQPAADVLNVGIVQGNVPTRIKLFAQGMQLALDRYIKGYETLANQGVDAVLTPEGAFPWLWVDRPTHTRNRFYQTILEKGVTAWVGSIGLQQDGSQQSNITQTLFTITGTGEVYSRYNKVKLVPLGEYTPFQSVLGGVINRLSPVEASMVPGDPNQHFDTPFGRAIVGICYESAFSTLFRNQAAAGGQFILTASNNDPYKAAMMAQHHAQDVMRAIETDRWAVRATNTGFSGIVDPHGRTLWISGFRTYETHAHTIYRRQTQTLYVRVGNWLTPVLLIGAAIGWKAMRHDRGRMQDEG